MAATKSLTSYPPSPLLTKLVSSQLFIYFDFYIFWGCFLLLILCCSSKEKIFFFLLKHAGVGGNDFQGTCDGISGDAPKIGYFVFGVFSTAATSNIWDDVLVICYEVFGICWDLLQRV